MHSLRKVATPYRDLSDTPANTTLDSLAGHHGHVACHRGAGDLANRRRRRHARDGDGLRWSPRPCASSRTASILDGEVRLLRPAQPPPGAAGDLIAGNRPPAPGRLARCLPCIAERGTFRTGRRTTRPSRFSAALKPIASLSRLMAARRPVACENGKPPCLNIFLGRTRPSRRVRFAA